MIILIDRTDPEVRIVLKGKFSEDDADALQRTFPELRRITVKQTDKNQLKLFAEEE